MHENSISIRCCSVIYALDTLKGILYEIESSNIDLSVEIKAFRRIMFEMYTYLYSKVIKHFMKIKHINSDFTRWRQPLS